MGDLFERHKYPYVDAYGTERWYNENGELHREGGPALIHPNGTNYWYKNGFLHREDGPAIFYAHNGKFYFYLNDKKLSFLDYLEKVPKDIAEQVLIEWGYLL